MASKERQTSGSAFKEKDLVLDAPNRALIAELDADPRLPVSELARRINMSAPAVRERLRRLEDAGVIAGYRMLLDPVRLGLPLAAFVRIKPTPGKLPKISRLAAETPEVVECHRITGDDCILIKLHVPGLEELEQVLDGFLAFGNTTTSIVVSTPVPARAPMLPDSAP